MQQNANLITVWVGDDVLKHSIEHGNKNFFDKYVYIITIIIKIL